MSRLASMAARAPVPVFVALGAGAADQVLQLLADPGVEVVASPRHATVLLVVGAVPASLHRSLAAVHDQLPEPRAAVWWTARSDGAPSGPLPVVAWLAPDEDPGPMLRRIHAGLMTGSRDSAPTILPEESPVDWQGVGPYGTGGEGMMGGTPYGRPMAMTGADRTDGLALDRLEVTVGPFLPGFPPGLTLEVAFQGDVLQEVALTDPDDPVPTGGPAGARLGTPPSLFCRALTEPVAIRDLELARARHQLGVVAGIAWLHGLPARARRLARLARQVDPGDADLVARLHRRLMRTHALTGATAGVGRLAEDGFGGAHSGIPARAAGICVDVRRDDPSYRRLGFEVSVRQEGDARARWRQRLDEAERSLRLAGAAGTSTATVSGVVEGLHGRLDEGGDARGAILPQLPAALTGSEWGDAVTTVASLDLGDAALPASHREGTGAKS